MAFPAKLMCMLLFVASRCHCETVPPKLILISMDSLKYKFIEDAPASGTTNFQYFIRNGVLLKQIMNVFPSLTYPNHYTILTGLYPESHGIVHNRFYDPTVNGYFLWSSAESNTDPKWFDVGAEPIYVTNTKAGRGRRSGTVLFPTSLTSVKGVAPDVMVENDGTYVATHNGEYEYPYVNMSATERVDRIISWFTNKTHPINLGLLYFHAPDETAHTYGPDSQQVKDEISGKLNNVLGYLINELRETKLLDSTNIILTADHGHTTRQRFVRLDDYIDGDSYRTGGMGADSVVTGIWPNEVKEEDIIQNLTDVTGTRVYRKDGPELAALHYTRSARIPPIVLVPDIGTVVVKNKAKQDTYSSIGVHGYDPERYPALRPVFIGMGPAFKKNYVSTKMFRTLDLYPLMCHLLDINPAPNNGSLDNVLHILADTNGKYRDMISVALTIGGVLASLVFQTNSIG